VQVVSVLSLAVSVRQYLSKSEDRIAPIRWFRPAATFLYLILASHLYAQNAQPSPVVPHHYLVVYRNAIIPSDAESRILSTGARLTQRNPHFGIAAAQSFSAEDDATTMRRLAAQPNVVYVLHDRLVTAHHLHVQPIPRATFSVVLGQQAPYDTYYTLSPQGWAVQQVGGYGNNIPGGPTVGPWNTTMGKGVRIAILDSGVDANHPDIAPNLALNLSEVDQSALPSACDDGSPQDQTGHGTWTASLAAGAIGPGTGQVIGVAPAAAILNIKVLERLPASIAGTSTLAATCTAGEATGLLSWVMQGIEDAVTNRADIISLSLGTIVDMSTGDGAGLKATFDQVTYAATQAGVILIAAAGNDGYDLSNPRYMEIPAQSRGVLAIVASTNSACAENLASGATCTPGPISLPYYSNHGAPLNALAAPGGSYPEGADLAVSGWVRGACSSGNPNTIDGPPIDSIHSYGCFNLGHSPYIQAIGTSASAPLAAGVAALLHAAHPTWSANEIITVMRSTAVPSSNLPAPQINASTALVQP
jgi:lantibiotic leader peptide-processing serine protease